MARRKRDEDEEETTEAEEEEESDEEETEERRLLTREDVLERLRECWEVCDFRNGRLSRTDKELLDMNLYIARLFTEVQEASDVSEVSSAIGFHYDDEDDEDDDGYSEGDFPDEGDAPYCKNE